MMLLLKSPQNLNFAEMCKAIRAEAGYSQSQMAEFLNVPKRTYLSWEYGEHIPIGHIAVWIADEYRRIQNAPKYVTS